MSGLVSKFNDLGVFIMEDLEGVPLVLAGAGVEFLGGVEEVAPDTCDFFAVLGVISWETTLQF